jgi:hypothetical protein
LLTLFSTVTPASRTVQAQQNLYDRIEAEFGLLTRQPHPVRLLP